MLSTDPARVAVFVSGGGTNLQALIDAGKRGEMPSAELVLVVSDKPGVGAIERAERAGIAWEVVAPGARFAERMREALASHGVEMVVLAGYLQKVPLAIVERYEGCMINVHPSLLPKYGGKGFYGLRVHRAVLEAGDTVSGATVHVVTEEFDDGPILLQHEVEVLPSDTPEALQERIKVEAEWRILPAATEMIAAKIVADEE